MSLIIVIIFPLIPVASQAQPNPPIGLYRSDPGIEETWTATAADASQCKGYSTPGSTFVPNGYAEVSGSGRLICFGTQTLVKFDGTNDVRQNVPSTISPFCGDRQYIQVAGQIARPISHSAGGPYYSSATCYCHVYLDVWNGTACSRGGQTIAFLENSNSSILPTGTNGVHERAFQVRVTQGVNPVAGVSVSFSIDVTPNSGGHEHHDAARPEGTLSGTQGTTDANGEVKVTFRAPEVAGIHTIKATCATCSNSPATKEIEVKVPDLLPISPNPSQNADGTFVYALTSVDQTHQGNGRYHHNQYYLTQQSRQNLRTMIEAFAAEGWGTVALNDASLYWGGRYDISSNWRAPHAGHRDGREIDISFIRAGNRISSSKQIDFYDKFCNSKKVSFPFSLLHHYMKSPHFHVYLEKQTSCWKSEK
ncbi:MAG: Ig-like domain-containing protein [Hydrogenophaga sp.]|nr:Ig-like domain-containing protein [Hydrogenophaga sp.]